MTRKLRSYIRERSSRRALNQWSSYKIFGITTENTAEARFLCRPYDLRVYMLRHVEYLVGVQPRVRECLVEVQNVSSRIADDVASSRALRCSPLLLLSEKRAAVLRLFILQAASLVCQLAAGTVEKQRIS